MTNLQKVILKDYLNLSLSKGDRTKLQILEATIKVLSKINSDNVSYESISKESELSRPLIKHYYPDKSELLVLSFKYIRANLQKLAVNSLSTEDSAKKILENYIEAVFKWPTKHPSHVRTWLFYYYLCSSDLKLRREHTKLTEMGKNRIIEIIKIGEKDGSFSKKIANKESTAKSIQQLITGGILELCTELRLSNKSDASKVSKRTHQLALSILKEDQ